MMSVKLDGAALRRIREDRGHSTTALAELLSLDQGRKISQSIVSRYETGDRQPSPKMFGALRRVLDCERHELLLPEDDATRAVDEPERQTA